MRLGGVEFFSGSPEGMLKWSQQALPIFERLADPEGIARSFHYIADGLREVGQFERSAELYKRSIEIRREHELGSVSAAIHSLGDLCLDKGDLPAAERYHHEALALAPDEDDVRLKGLLPGRARRGDSGGP